VKKTRLAKQWLDQLRRDESFGFPKPENVYVRNLSKRSKSLHVLRCRKSLHIAPQGVKIKVDKTGQNEIKAPFEPTVLILFIKRFTGVKMISIQKKLNTITITYCQEEYMYLHVPSCFPIPDANTTNTLFWS